MEIKAAPKRSRAERDMISRTYYLLSVYAKVYDRNNDALVAKTITLRLTKAELEKEGEIVKRLKNELNPDEQLLTLEYHEAHETRYIMSEDVFLKYAQIVEEE